MEIRNRSTCRCGDEANSDCCFVYSQFMYVSVLTCTQDDRIAELLDEIDAHRSEISDLKMELQQNKIDLQKSKTLNLQASRGSTHVSHFYAYSFVLLLKSRCCTCTDCT